MKFRKLISVFSLASAIATAQIVVFSNPLIKLEGALAQSSSRAKIINRNYGKCLNLGSNENRNDGQVTAYDCLRHRDQEWRIQDLGNGYAKIVNRNYDKCLNLGSNENYNDGLVTVWDCVDHRDQEWRIQDLGNGYAKIVNRNYDKCLNLGSNQNRNDGLITVWDCVDHPDQEWSVVSQ